MPSMRASATFWLTPTNGSKDTTVKSIRSSMSLWNAENSRLCALGQRVAHAHFVVARLLGLELRVAAEAKAIRRVGRAEAAAGQRIDARAPLVEGIAVLGVPGDGGAGRFVIGVAQREQRAVRAVRDAVLHEEIHRVRVGFEALAEGFAAGLLARNTSRRGSARACPDGCQSYCASSVSRSVSRKSGDWFCWISSSMCENANRAVPVVPTGSRTSAAAVEVTKSWSTGVRKKSEYSELPDGAPVAAARLRRPRRRHAARGWY